MTYGIKFLLDNTNTNYKQHTTGGMQCAITTNLCSRIREYLF